MFEPFAAILFFFLIAMMSPVIGLVLSIANSLTVLFPAALSIPEGALHPHAAAALSGIV